jgi:hypothetical protein
MAAQLRAPLHEVMQWPQWSVDLMQTFLAREPPAEDRCEVAAAQQTALWAGSKTPKGKPRPKVSDFMLFRDVWERRIDASRYTPDELKTMAALGLKLQ